MNMSYCARRRIPTFPFGAVFRVLTPPIETIETLPTLPFYLSTLFFIRLPRGFSRDSTTLSFIWWILSVALPPE